MNCSVQMDLLSSLLWFLTSQLPYRSFILYSDAPEAAALAKAMREHGRFLLSLQGTVGASRLAQPSHTMFIRVYLGKYFHEKVIPFTSHKYSEKDEPKKEVFGKRFPV